MKAVKMEKIPEKALEGDSNSRLFAFIDVRDDSPPGAIGEGRFEHASEGIGAQNRKSADIVDDRIGTIVELHDFSCDGFWGYASKASGVANALSERLPPQGK
jgi:hypothetical protein